MDDDDPSPADLLSIAFHREKVRARQDARRGGTAFEQALSAVLHAAAGGVSLRALVCCRRGAQQQLADQRSRRTASAALAAASRKGRRSVDPHAWQGWFDGSAMPNPGRIGLGARLQSPDGQPFDLSRTAGYGDSNLAEYLALIAVLEQAVRTKVRHLVVHGDSRIVIDDVLGAVPIRTSALHGPQAQARRLLGRFDSVSLVWIPRAKNDIADALARRAQVCDPGPAPSEDSR